jgi:hypothetical protein
MLIKKSCPHLPGVFDSNRFVYKKCEATGIWEGFNKTGKEFGWTDYDTCLTEAALRHTKIPVHNITK